VASNETVGLIAAGAVIGGAFLGGVSQAIVAWRQHVHERNDRKAVAYRDALRHLYAVPARLVEALPLDPGEQQARMQDYWHQYDQLRSDLSLFAPKAIRDIIDRDLRKAMESWAEAGRAFAEAGTEKRPGDVRIQMRQDFADHVQPVLQRLADEMARDANTR
jgi:hypothetical protein